MRDLIPISLISVVLDQDARGSQVLSRVHERVHCHLMQPIGSGEVALYLRMNPVDIPRPL